MRSFQALKAQLTWLLKRVRSTLQNRNQNAGEQRSQLSADWSEFSYQEVVDNQAELICRFLADGTIVYANPAYCDYFGVSPEEIVGTPYQPVIYAADREAVNQQVRTLSVDNPQVVIENRVVVDGELRWTQWHNRCFCNIAGDVTAYQAVGRDISQLKATEAELRHREQQYRTLSETLEQRVADRTAEIATANAALKKEIHERLQIEANLATRLKQQAAMTQLSQMALSGLNLRELFAETTRLLADSLDVDYAKVLQLLPDNQSLRLLSGVGWQPGLVGQAIVAAHPNCQAGYTLMTQKPIVVEDLNAETRFNSPLLLKNHGVVSGISTIIQGVDKQPFGVLGVHSTYQRSFTQDDVNFLQAVANLLAAAINRKHTEQALQQLNQTLEQRVQERTQALEEVNQELESFSYSVAHDLRAPLRSIQGFAQVLVEDYGQVLDDLGKDYIHRMAGSAEHLDVLVQDLLTYSRLGRTAIHLQPVNLSRIIDHVLEDLQPLIQAEQAQLTVASDLPTVRAQRSILKQVLTNLIDNSIKFVAPEKKPQIHIWAEARETKPGDLDEPSIWIRLWIEDQGIGIASSHQTRIFEAFERLHGVEAYSGTGIGLAIVKRGIDRLGGRVGVESHLKQGSRFWIELPLAYSPG
jgi:PAS domain S-box-containing protein